jgi:hypothetical protein
LPRLKEPRSVNRPVRCPSSYLRIEERELDADGLNWTNGASARLPSFVDKRSPQLSEHRVGERQRSG